MLGVASKTIPHSEILVQRPQTGGILETMVCSILMFMWSLGPRIMKTVLEREVQLSMQTWLMQTEKSHNLGSYVAEAFLRGPSFQQKQRSALSGKCRLHCGTLERRLAASWVAVKELKLSYRNIYVYVYVYVYV